MKKILVITAQYGAGHESVAKNIKSYLANKKEFEISFLNITDNSNFLGELSVKTMNFVAKYRPEVIYNIGYKVADTKIIGAQQRKIVKLFFDNEHNRAQIKKINPDIIISTHFYTSTMGVYYNELGLIDSKIITVLTDYKMHSEWLAFHQGKDFFVVANEIMKNQLTNYGVKEEKVYPYGIPLDPSKMETLRLKENSYKLYNLNKDYKTVIFFGGSSIGSTTYYKYFKTLYKSKLKINLVFICGHNEQLKKQANILHNNYNKKNICILGYTKDVYNLLNIADLVITKPGGATITESTEFKVPLILLPGVGGQERDNKNYVEKMGYGVFTRNMIHFKKEVKKIIINDNYYGEFKKELNKINSNNSNQMIYNLIKDKIKDL